MALSLGSPSWLFPGKLENSIYLNWYWFRGLILQGNGSGTEITSLHIGPPRSLSLPTDNKKNTHNKARTNLFASNRDQPTPDYINFVAIKMLSILSYCIGGRGFHNPIIPLCFDCAKDRSHP